MEINFDQMRQELSVHYNELIRVMNSHQEKLLDGSSRVEIDSAEARELMNNLRAPLMKLMCLECAENGITSTSIKLSRMIVQPINDRVLCRA